MNKTTPEEAIAIASKLGIVTRGIYPSAFLFYPKQLAAFIDEVRANRPTKYEFIDGLHPLTHDLIDLFAAALKEKLAVAEKKYGYSDGWRSPDWMDECRAQLLAHVAKGDPRDVAAYCAFLWHHGESTATAKPAPPVALSTLTDDDIEQFIYDRCRRFVTADMIPAIRELAASAPAQQAGQGEPIGWMKPNESYAPDAFRWERTDMHTNAVFSTPPQPVSLEDIEKYRMQMAGIMTAALGYWKEGDAIHPDYDTVALRDVAKLYAKYDALFQEREKATAPQPVAAEPNQDWWNELISDVSAIDCRYRGDPSYDHDAYWMRAHVTKMLEKRRDAK